VRLLWWSDRSTQTSMLRWRDYHTRAKRSQQEVVRHSLVARVLIRLPVLLFSRIQPILLARYVQGVHEKMDNSFALLYEEDGFRRFKARVFSIARSPRGPAGISGRDKTEYCTLMSQLLIERLCIWHMDQFFTHLRFIKYRGKAFERT
jgi:hypothetical protein